MLAIESHSLATSPTKRGMLVRTRLLCGVVPPPPPVVSPLPEPTEADTTRQRYEVLHVADNSCKTCHQMMDPIGFAFEHLDASGRFRAKEGKFDIDDSGVVTRHQRRRSALPRADRAGPGPRQAARDDGLPGGLRRHLAFGVSQENAACLVRGAAAELRAGASVLDFFLRLARSDHFRLRQP